MTLLPWSKLVILAGLFAVAGWLLWAAATGRE